MKIRIQLKNVSFSLNQHWPESFVFPQ